MGKNFEVLEGVNIGEKTYLEFFSQQDEDILKDISIGEEDKINIYYCRTKYFEQMGIKTDKQLSDFKNSKEYYEYLTKQEDVKKIIILPREVKEIAELRTKAYEETQKEFTYNSKDFNKSTKQFDENSKNAIYEMQKDKSICIKQGAVEGNFAPLVFLTIREEDGGSIAHIVLHEIGHAIESEGIPEICDMRSGFENGTINVPKNPYNDKKRKYERFNETIRDMLTIEANEILHKKGVYLFEPKEIVKNSKDFNTSNICKNLLTEFLGKYRKEVMNVLLFGDIETLYNKVGEENFEELVDIVNKVDSLENNKLELTEKLKNNEKEDPSIIEYHKQLERLEKVYYNMEQHMSKEEILDSVIKATKEKTRMGQIQGVKESLEINNKEGENDLHKREL